MQISLKALKKFLKLDIPAQEIAKKLDMLGIEVESIEEMCPSFSGIIVAKVESTQPHPDAERLTLADVFDGKNHHKVVCAAKNCRPGLFPFAPIGATVGDLKIAEVTLRGEISQGMLLAEDELGLATEKCPGIWELNPGESLGDSIDAYFTDTIFHIGLTPNLAHCQSVYGIARELSARLGLELVPLPLPLQGAASGLPLTIQGGCSRYTLTQVTIDPQPTTLEMRGHLEAHGIRAISLPVDCTNTLMTTYGLPTHAFDASSLTAVSVRPIEDPSTLTTLDDKTQQLEKGDLAIFNGETPIALAGAMGGASTQITPETTEVAFEAAIFDGAAIRRTCRRLGLRTESSARFERGADPAMPLIAAALFIEELKKAGSLKGAPLLSEAGTSTLEKKEICLRFARAQQMLGIEISAGEIAGILESLGFGVELKEDHLIATVPTWRTDVSLEIDLIEEVVRLWGYDRLPETRGLWANSTLGDDPRWTFQQKVREALLRLGAQEMLTCNLISEEMLQPWEKSIDLSQAQRVKNASVVQYSWLRPSLLPGLCTAIRHNISHGMRDLLAFETGTIHLEAGEAMNCAIAWTGSALPEHFTRPKKEVDFLDLKALVDELLNGLSLPPHTLQPSNHESLHPHQQGALIIEGCTVGHFGRCHPLVEEKIGCPHLFIAEICLTDLIGLQRKEKTYEPISAFPSTKRDWTLCTLRSMPYAALESACLEHGGELLKKIELISLYEGDHLGKERHNVSVRLTYQKEDATLSHEEAETAHERLQTQVQAALTDFLGTPD